MKSSCLLAVLVLAAGLAGCSSSSAVSSTSASGSGGGASAAPSGGGTPAAGAASGASLEVTLNHTRIASALGVGVVADVTGNVPQLLTGDGQPITAADTEVMGTQLSWGDGAQDGSDAGDVTCSTTGTLVPLSENFTFSHTYAKAGTYTVTFTAGACAALKDVTKTVEITVG